MHFKSTGFRSRMRYCLLKWLNLIGISVTKELQRDMNIMRLNPLYPPRQPVKLFKKLADFPLNFLVDSRCYE